MKTIVLFGAGKSATVLIDYLIDESRTHGWKFIIADHDKAQIQAKTGNSTFAEAIQLDINNEHARGELVKKAHVVISMLPPTLHFLIAKDCVEYRKHLLTASYVDEKVNSLKEEIANRKILFLCEMGLDPGIDHMSAMHIIDRIHGEGGSIHSFKSHCGGLVAPENDDNPWRYKVSWNPRNIVMAGCSGAVYKFEGEIITRDYTNLFDTANTLSMEGLDELAYYPNRDSLGYMSLYRLPEAKTFMRTTLRYPVFFYGWNALVHAGLTNDTITLDSEGMTFEKWSVPILPFLNDLNRLELYFLGVFEDLPIPENARTSADILQYLVETKLAMQPQDKDMIVMLHEFGYTDNKGHSQSVSSSLLVTGENGMRTAMAKTVGLPLGIAAKLILNSEIALRGLHIPTRKEIYEPVLKELGTLGISFTEEHA